MKTIFDHPMIWIYTWSEEPEIKSKRKFLKETLSHMIQKATVSDFNKWWPPVLSVKLRESSAWSNTLAKKQKKKKESHD